MHRADRPVGGLVAFARTSKAAFAPEREQLRTHAMARQYRRGRGRRVHAGRGANFTTGSCRMRRQAGARRSCSGAPGAKEARLSFRVLGRDAALDTTLVHVRLQTGRKHQIRVQLAHSGHPLVADMRYGRGVRGQPVALWGAVLRLTHPTRKEPMTFLSAPRGDAFLPYAATISGFINDQRKGADL